MTKVYTTYIYNTHAHTYTLVINGYLWATIINDVSVSQGIKTLNLQQSFKIKAQMKDVLYGFSILITFLS